MPEKYSTVPVLQLWFAHVSERTHAAETSVIALLSGSENERLKRIKSESRRREYLLSRALMRHALSRHFQRAEHQWEIVDRAQSKPDVKNLPEDGFISMSHSRGAICFAIANCPLGIDLEFTGKLRKFTALARMFMNESERDRLARCLADPAEYFYRLWCAKEACYKLLPPAEQAHTLLTTIDYARLGNNDHGRYLHEGRIGEFAFAAVTRAKPVDIDCHYFLESKASLGHLDLIDVESGSV